MQRLGPFLVALGTLALAWAGVESLIQPAFNAGGIAATGLFIVILGLVLLFPTLLSDDTGQTSTMRVCVLMVVSLFVVLTVKAGWGAPDLEHLKLQDSWVWVLAAAFGGKAFQSFAENGGSPSGPAKLPGQPAGRSAKRDATEGIEDSP
jgi:hypothetical protein